jgi:hypothetical protein
VRSSSGWRSSRASGASEVSTDADLTATGADTEQCGWASALERHPLQTGTIEVHDHEWLDGPIGPERVPGVEDESK